jgi:hypothetical protein
MTKILELPEELQRDLHRAAERDQVSDEDLALRVLREYLEREEHRRAVKEAGDYVQQKNAELYRRLA